MYSISQTGLSLIQEMEGLKLKPYLDKADVPTIGDDGKPHIHIEMEEPLSIETLRETVYGITKQRKLVSRTTGEIVKVFAEQWIWEATNPVQIS